MTTTAPSCGETVMTFRGRRRGQGSWVSGFKQAAPLGWWSTKLTETLPSVLRTCHIAHTVSKLPPTPLEI